MNTNRRRNLIRLILAGFTILSACMLGTPWASAAYSEEPGVAPSSPPAISEPVSADMVFISRSLRKLLREGFVIDGPTEVVKVDTDSITLFTAKNKDWTVKFSGKKVLIRDYQGNEVLLSSIKPEMHVYTCRKSNDIVIFVMAKREARNDH